TSSLKMKEMNCLLKNRRNYLYVRKWKRTNKLTLKTMLTEKFLISKINHLLNQTYLLPRIKNLTQRLITKVDYSVIMEVKKNNNKLVKELQEKLNISKIRKLGKL